MSGGWQLRPQEAYISDGNALSNSQGLYFPNPSSNGVYSPFQTLIDALPFDCSSVIVNLSSTIGGSAYMGFDLAIGPAGSEEVIAPRLGCEGWGGNIKELYLPIQIPAGARVAGRTIVYYCIGNGGLNVCTSYGALDFSAGPYSRCDLLADDIQILPSSTDNVKGPWYTLTSSTDRAIAESLLLLNNYDAFSPSGSNLLDIGVGAAGSEVVIIPDISCGVGLNVTPCSYPWRRTAIPAGSRVAARMQATAGYAVGASLYGVG